MKKLLKAANRIVEAGLLIYIVGPLLIILTWLLREMWSAHPLQSALAGLLVLFFICRGNRKDKEKEDIETQKQEIDTEEAHLSAIIVSLNIGIDNLCDVENELVLCWRDEFELIVRRREFEA